MLVIMGLNGCSHLLTLAVWVVSLIIAATSEEYK
jgi:hypothetical protein